MAKDFFKEKNITYTEHNVAIDIVRRKEMLEKSGQLGVPVIFVGDQMIIGFNKPKVAAALGV